MTEEEIDKAAEADSDCLPLSQQELNEFRRTSITDADLVVRSLSSC
ncbi:hypothetical protein NIES298_01880 [Microcystis aeruginosa NIES-298]|nr:hypothetical protein NIES298_01880 [Microcystis aeruginosa NIES-298]